MIYEQAPRGVQDKLQRVWSAGRLEYLFHSGQEAAYSRYVESDSRLFVLDVARRWGKSYFCSVLAMSKALSTTHARIPYVAATMKMVKEIINPLFRDILAGCPPQLRPDISKAEARYRFHNGSEIIVVGADSNPDSARGTHLDFGILDEAAFIRDLGYMVTSILIPQMQGKPAARLLMASTPPTTPLHSWTQTYVPEAKVTGAYFHATIEDNPRLTPEEVEEFNALVGGRDSTTCRRENYAEHVVDSDLAIVPEFAAVETDIVKESKRPDYFDTYVAMDPGFVDLWATLFGYYDFLRAKLVIEDELVVQRCTTSEWAEKFTAKRRELWGEAKPYSMVSDVDPKGLADLSNNHGIHFSVTAKDDKEAAINNMRIWVHSRRIEINPRCVNLIVQLKWGIWNSARTKFERMVKITAPAEGALVSDLGHFDCIDALIYMVRNVNTVRNPWPRLPEGVSKETHMIVERNLRKNEETENLSKMFSASGKPKFKPFGAR